MERAEGQRNILTYTQIHSDKVSTVFKATNMIFSVASLVECFFF